MDSIVFSKAIARLEAFRRAMPEGDDDVEGQDVADYNNILETLRQQTGISFEEFAIPDGRLKRHLASHTPAGWPNKGKSRTTYSDSRFCDHTLFLRQLDAAIIFLNGLLPKQEKTRIGF